MAAVDGRATVFKVGMRPTIGHKKYVEYSHTTVVGLVSAARVEHDTREFLNEGLVKLDVLKLGKARARARLILRAFELKLSTNFFKKIRY